MTAPLTHILTNTVNVVSADTPAAGWTAPVLIGKNRGYGHYAVSVLTNSGTLTVALETCDTASAQPDDWAQLGSVIITGVGDQILFAAEAKAQIRVWYGLTANAAASFAVAGESQLVFCTPTDVKTLSLPSVAIDGVPLDDQAEACLAATDEAVSYLGTFYDLPLVSWGYALRLHTANIAAYHIMRRRGFSPDRDDTIRLGYTDAIAWLQKGVKGDPSIVDQSPSDASDGVGTVANPVVLSAPSRGWSIER